MEKVFFHILRSVDSLDIHYIGVFKVVSPIRVSNGAFIDILYSQNSFAFEI